MPVLHAPAGRRPREGDALLPPGTVAVGVLDGLLLRETPASGGAALSGPGDLLEPWTVRPELRWTVCLPLRLAVIGRELIAALQPWPQALASLLARALHGESGQLEALAVAGRRGDDERMLGHLGLVAARWGRPTAGGTLVAMPLAPDLLGRLAGLRRGVGAAVAYALGERGLALQRRDGTWLLRRPSTRPPVAATALTRRERDERRETMMTAFARASDAHEDAVEAMHTLAGSLVPASRAQPPASAEGSSA
jgi:hypothetical protein